MFVDSHCHLSADILRVQADQILQQMAAAQVTRALCVSTSLTDFEEVQKLVSAHPCLWASAGVHPNEPKELQPTKEQLLEQASHVKVIAIGETGLDYYRQQDTKAQSIQWQHERFDTHIDVAREMGLPLIIHTRDSAHETLAILKAAVNTPGSLTGVFHCFTEDLNIARQVLDLGFYVSFSGILTFKNAATLKEVAKAMPHDACLIETDSPYLAPVPYRGKTNSPAYVPHVAATLAELWGEDIEYVAMQTTQNFERLFNKVNAPS